MKNLENKIEYKVICLPEDLEIRGNVLASGDKQADLDAENEVIEQLNNGNEWAWCRVQVVAYIPGIELEGVDFLGGCSYRSREEFMQPGGYYDDMKEIAKEDLLKQIQELQALICC